MVLIIDGYNILKQLEEYESVSREQFIKTIIAYAQLKNVSIILVFDSGPFNYPITELHGAVKVVYAGQGHSADEYIKTYCANKKNNNAVVVSSDRAILQAVQEYRAQIIKGDEFVSLLKGALVKKNNGHEYNELHKFQNNDQEIDSLMIYGSSLPIKKQMTDQKQDRSKGQQLSKKEKKKQQLLKKL